MTTALYWGVPLPAVKRRCTRRSPNTSRYSTIGKDGKHLWGTFLRLSMSGSSMQGRLQHTRAFHVHYLHQGHP